MSSPTYAVYFPEISAFATQKGYLLEEILGEGVEGKVNLVYSVIDGKHYARKKTCPMSRAGTDFHNNEKLQSSPGRTPKVGFHPVDSNHLRILQWWLFGGFLGRLCLGDRSFSDLTESILWSLFASQLEVITFYHAQGLGMMDSHMANILLHFEEGSKFPLFYTADLGHVGVLDPEIWEHAEPGKPRQLKSLEALGPASRFKQSIHFLREDLSHIVNNLHFLSTFTPADGGPKFYSDDLEMDLSQDFMECLDFLNRIINNLHIPMPEAERKALYEKYGVVVTPEVDFDLTLYNGLGELKDRVKRHAAQARANDREDTDFSWAKYEDAKPWLWPDRNMLLFECKMNEIAGPFQIARVDPVTFEVLDLEETQYGVCNPQVLDAGRGIRAAGPFPASILVEDPLRDIPDSPWWQDDRKGNHVRESGAEDALSTELFAECQDASLWVRGQHLLQQQQQRRNDHNESTNFGDAGLPY